MSDVEGSEIGLVRMVSDQIQAGHNSNMLMFKMLEVRIKLSW